MPLRPERQHLVNAALGGLSAKEHFNYAQVRPIPYDDFNALMNGNAVTVTTDCSGFVSCCFNRAGQPDPNGRNYDGLGFTGTLLATLPHISRAAVRPGDLVVFGPAPGHHVVMVVAEGVDPQCVSHGGQGDPKEAPLSHFQSLGRMTFLRSVPKQSRLPRRKQHVKWIVRGDGGEIIGHVYTSKARWARRHWRVVRRQQELLHFDRHRP